ncbi:MAG: hypothetical protein KGI80_04085 [Verrucomicrobiota bacterium]|nr:hypothetical protein [Verrucomicrobiota bacterium]
MKKAITIIIVILSQPLLAQEEVGMIAQQTAVSAEEETAPVSSTWPNVIFAISALVAIAVGVTVISTNTGSFDR